MVCNTAMASAATCMSTLNSAAMLSAAASQPCSYTASKMLPALGFQKCPWRSLPSETRYPRIIDPHGHRPREGIVRCVERLAGWQEEGDILFVLMEGQGLSAMMSGAYHGNRDDDDVDMRVFSRKGVTEEAHYKWCETESISLGSFGFFPVEPPTMKFPAYLKARGTESVGTIPWGTIGMRACIGRWETFDVLLPHPKSHYFRNLHGGSYWVPPVKGGKEMGQSFPGYMDPSSSLFPYFDRWLVDFHDGLRSGVDLDHDSIISTIEFFRYVKGNTRVNQKWLQLAMQKRPCVVANALIHYEHLMKFCNLAREMRQRCEKCGKRCNLAESKKCCHLQNWNAFKSQYGEGPSYYEEENEAGRTSNDTLACKALLDA